MSTSSLDTIPAQVAVVIDGAEYKFANWDEAAAFGAAYQRRLLPTAASDLAHGVRPVPVPRVLDEIDTRRALSVIPSEEYTWVDRDHRSVSGMGPVRVTGSLPGSESFSSLGLVPRIGDSVESPPASQQGRASSFRLLPSAPSADEARRLGPVPDEPPLPLPRLPRKPANQPSKAKLLAERQRKTDRRRRDAAARARRDQEDKESRTPRIKRE